MMDRWVWSWVGRGVMGWDCGRLAMNPKAIQVSWTKGGHWLFPQGRFFMGVIKDAWSVTRNNYGCR